MATDPKPHERFPKHLWRHHTFNSLDAAVAHIEESAAHYGDPYHARLSSCAYEPSLWMVSEDNAEDPTGSSSETDDDADWWKRGGPNAD